MRAGGAAPKHVHNGPRCLLLDGAVVCVVGHGGGNRLEAPVRRNGLPVASVCYTAVVKAGMRREARGTTVREETRRGAGYEN